MYFIALFLLSWIWFFYKANKYRWRDLFGAVVYTSFLGLLTDLIMVHYKLWAYEGLPHPLYTIPLLLDFSVYPVVAFLFTQKLPSTWQGLFWRIGYWSFFSIIFEWITLRTGHIQHRMWWNLWLSLAADIFIYLSIALIYQFYSSAYEVPQT